MRPIRITKRCSVDAAAASRHYTTRPRARRQASLAGAAIGREGRRLIVEHAPNVAPQEVETVVFPGIHVGERIHVDDGRDVTAGGGNDLAQEELAAAVV